MAEALPLATTTVAGSKHQLVQNMLVEGAHPFPADMEETLRRICDHDPLLIDNLDQRYFAAWNAGQELPAGRAMLKAISTYVSTKQVQVPS